MLTAPRPRTVLGPGMGLPAFSVSCLVAGAMAVLAPVLIGGLLAVGGALMRGQHLYRDLLFALVAGSMLLTYGFANVGFSFGPLPVPVTELLLLPLVAWSLLQAKSLRSIGLPLLLVALFVGLASLRLIADFPSHGKLAIRDFTLPLEALTLLVGFWALNTYGLRWACRLLLAVLIMVAAYGALMPWRETVAGMGPTVGLQQPVQLLGQFDSLGPALAAALFFFLLMVKSPWSIILGALCLGELALLQMRGLYLGVPLAALVVLIASNRVSTRLPGRLAGAVAVAAILLVLVAPMIPSGRLGPVNAAFAVSQLETLLGKEGPGDGSYEKRQQWLERTWERQRESPETLLLGLGLGVDLASGFAANDLVDVRKPHNDHLEIFARMGAAGFSIWVGLLASVIIPVWRTVRSDRPTLQERHFLICALGLFTIYLFTATTQPVLAFPQGSIPLFLVMGMSLAVVRGLDSQPDVSPAAAWTARAFGSQGGAGTPASALGSQGG